MNLIKHVQEDPNAIYHSVFGAAAFIAAGAVALSYFTIFESLTLGFLASLLTGVAIEVSQRLQGGKNSNKESLLDAAGTFLWFVYPIVKLWSRNVSR